MLRRERYRQLAHLLAGGPAGLVPLLGDPRLLSLLYLAALPAVFVVRRTPLARFLFRPGEGPASGAFFYLAGAGLAFLLLPGRLAAGSVAILAAGDSMATLFGLSGVSPLAWNRRKTWRGLVAFVVAACPLATAAMLWAAPVDPVRTALLALGATCAAAVVESLSIRGWIDENLWVLGTAALVLAGLDALAGP